MVVGAFREMRKHPLHFVEACEPYRHSPFSWAYVLRWLPTVRSWQDIASYPQGGRARLSQALLARNKRRSERSSRCAARAALDLTATTTLPPHTNQCNRLRPTPINAIAYAPHQSMQSLTPHPNQCNRLRPTLINATAYGTPTEPAWRCLAARRCRAR